ncbi:MAG TPA: hypothetical protein VHD63_15125 [Ktedonobacteraceae bacterium]|nr:hypothetical protein [Ktedonobacteraceae bacterium]
MYAAYKGWSGTHVVCLLAVLPLCCMLFTACSTHSSHALNSSIRQVQIREDDFHIRSSSTVFAHDVPYHFVIKNDGHTPHEFMITPLTLSTMNGMSMSDMDQLSLADVMQIAPGQTRTLDYTFPRSTAGTHLQFACHYPGHYEAGMSLNILIRT